MKSVIPFSKELEFSTKIQEITSISLEREFEVKDLSIEGNLFVTGEYKSHEVSANVLPFSYKIPFTIEVPENLVKESVSLEISDFAYDIEEEKKIKVNIELELNAEVDEKEEIEEIEPPQMEVDPEEIIRMMESSAKEEQEEIEKEQEIESEEPKEEEEVLEETKEEPKEIIAEENRGEEEEMILQTLTTEDEYKTYHIHIIKDGENIETICTMYGSNANLLAEYNDVSNIIPGEKLIIPSNDES